jgi:hypothetical protein
VADVGEDPGPKQIALSCGFLFFGSKELSFSFRNEAPCITEFQHGCSIARDLSRYTNVV